MTVSLTGYSLSLLCIAPCITGFSHGALANDGKGLAWQNIQPKRTWDGHPIGGSHRHRSYVYLKPNVTIDHIADPDMCVFLHGTNDAARAAIALNGFNPATKPDSALKHGCAIYGSVGMVKASKYSRYWNSVDCFWSEGKVTAWLLCGFKKGPGKRLVDAFDPMFDEWRKDQDLTRSYKLGKAGNGMGKHFKENTDIGAIYDSSAGVDGEDIIVFDEKDVEVLGLVVVAKPLTRQAALSTGTEAKATRPYEGFMHWRDFEKPPPPPIQKSHGHGVLDPRLPVTPGMPFFDDGQKWIVWSEVAPKKWGKDEEPKLGAWYYPADEPKPTEKNFKKKCCWSSLYELQLWTSQYLNKKKKLALPKAKAESIKAKGRKRGKDGGTFAK